MLGMYDYVYDKESGDEMPSFNKFVENTEFIFLIAFTLEAVIKIMAVGFVFAENTYLRNPWNQLDFTVVVTGLA